MAPASLGDWLAGGLCDDHSRSVPHVRRLRPDLAWEDVLRIMNGPQPEARRWTQSRLLRAVNAYVRDGFLPETVLTRAGRRETDDRLPAIVAAIKGTDPDITLQAICNRLESKRERTPRGRTSWPAVISEDAAGAGREAGLAWLSAE
jgi:hypothetical protein